MCDDVTSEIISLCLLIDDVVSECSQPWRCLTANIAKGKLHDQNAGQYTE